MCYLRVLVQSRDIDLKPLHLAIDTGVGTVIGVIQQLSDRHAV
jgi:hypothetical protein